MKRISLLIIGLSIFCSCNTQQYNKDIVANYKHYYDLSRKEFPFIARELVEIYKSDTTIITNYFVRNRECRSSVDLYINDMCANALGDSLLKIRDDKNCAIIDKMLSEINIVRPQKPNLDWGNVYLCGDNCPFGDYPPDVYWNVEFSLVYMTEFEIKQMIAFEKGEQWGYVLQDVLCGDCFEGFLSTDSGKREIDRRIKQYLINKWSPCQIPEVQELVKVLEESMPLAELENPVDVIKGTWRGTFGNKTINLTIDYDASIADEEKAEAKRTRRGWTSIGNYGVLTQSIFDGQPESKAVSAKGYYTDGGKDVIINLIEQPDTVQWNGEFNLWVNRKTNKMRGIWESNNKKLKREFELEKVSE